MTQEEIAKTLKPIKWQEDAYKPNEVYFMGCFGRRFAVISGTVRGKITLTINPRYNYMPDPPTIYKDVTIEEAMQIARHWQVEDEYKRLSIEDQKEKERRSKLLDDIKSYIRSNVTLHFVRYGHAEEWFTQTEIGYYSIEYSGGAYSIMTPDDEYHKGVYTDLASAMDACIEYHRNALIRAIEDGSKK